MNKINFYFRLINQLDFLKKKIFEIMKLPDYSFLKFLKYYFVKIINFQR